MISQAELASVYDSDAERDRFTEIMVLMYLAMLAAVHKLLALRLHIDLGELIDDKAAIRQMVLKAGARTVAVDATTQRLIAETIARGQMLGLSNWEIANGSQDGSFKGIEGLFTETWKGRPEMVVRTELQKAMLEASHDRYQKAGIKWVVAQDGDFDAACSDRNGRLYPINNPPDLLHPRCTLTISPAGEP